MTIGKKTFRKTLSVLMAMVMLFSMAVPAYAETINISVTGTYYQTRARSMLSLINNFRRSNPYCWNSSNTKEIQYNWDHDLTYDYGLEKIAMKRAAEIALKSGHTRPNGNSCFTVSSEVGYTGKHSGENIAMNTVGTAERAFIQWREDNDDYSGQGHRRNMLGSFTHIGIAIFKVGNRYCYVQAFGYGNGSTVETKANDSETTVSVQADASAVQATGGSISCNVSSVSMEVGSTQALPKAQLELTMQGYAISTSPSDAAITFKSSDSTGLTISGTNMTAKKAGTYKLTASAAFGGKTYTKDITVTVKPHSLTSSTGTITLSQTKYTYDGTEKSPAVTVKYGSTVLIKDTDYDLTYKGDKTNAGTVTVTATGKGNYSGTLSTSYNIAAVNASAAKVTLEYTETDQTGSALTPSVTSVTLGGKTIAASNYTVGYSNNVNVGTATVTVTFKNNYSGTATANFTINKRKIPIVAVQGSLIGGNKNGSAINLSGATVKIVSVSDPEVNVTAKVDGSKFTANVPEGQFKMTVSKAGYVTREYTLNAKAGASFTAELHEFGDVNGDGAVDITDVTKLISHVRGVKKFTDAYDLKVANCDQKGGIDITDVTVAISKVRGIK